DDLAGSRKDRGAEDDERAALDVGRQLVQDAVEDPHGGVHELVDRGPDHEHDDPRPLEHRGIARQLEAAGGEQLAQQCFGAGLAERYLPRPDHLDLGLVDVVDADAEAAVREREGERKPDGPASWTWPSMRPSCRSASTGSRAVAVGATASSLPTRTPWP